MTNTDRPIINPKNLNCKITINLSDLGKPQHTFEECLIEEKEQMIKDVIWFVKNDYLRIKEDVCLLGKGANGTDLSLKE
jgi:hypothetical protein